MWLSEENKNSLRKALHLLWTLIPLPHEAQLIIPPRTPSSSRAGKDKIPLTHRQRLSPLNKAKNRQPLNAVSSPRVGAACSETHSASVASSWRESKQAARMGAVLFCHGDSETIAGRMNPIEGFGRNALFVLSLGLELQINPV